LALVVTIGIHLHHLSDVCGDGLLVPYNDAKQVRLESGSKKLACNPPRIAITGDPVAVTSAYARQLGCSALHEESTGLFHCTERTPLRFTVDGVAGAGDIRYRAYRDAAGRWVADFDISGG